MLYKCPKCGDTRAFTASPNAVLQCLAKNCMGEYQPTNYQPEASSYQVGGDHYKNLELQPWDVMKSWATKKEFVAYLWLTTIKYIARWQKKNGVEDLKKAKHYLEKLIEELEECNTTNV